MFKSSFHILVCSFILTFLTIGCSGKSDSSDDKPPFPVYESSTPFPVYESSTPLAKGLASASLDCETSECESNRKDFESVGMVGMIIKGLATDSEFSIGQCTGFLYGANDIVALNSHCITDSMWDQRDDCSQYLAIKFPETPEHASEVRNCVQILYRSDLAQETSLAFKPDYAYFRINPVKRTPLALASEPMKTRDTISVRKINPLQKIKKLGGHMDYAHCQLQSQSLLNINFTDEWSLTGLGVKLSDSSQSCKIIQGNSGSPVLNIRNEIIGFTQSFLTSDFIKTLKSDALREALSNAFKIKVKFNPPDSIPEHFQFTQALCANQPNKLHEKNQVCQSHQMKVKTDEYEILSGTEITDDINSYISKIKKEILTQYPAFMTYEFTKEESAHVYSISPRCLLHPSKWDKRAIDPAYSRLIGENKTIHTVLKPTKVELNVIFNLDNNFVLKNNILGHETKVGRFITTIENSKIVAKQMIASDEYANAYTLENQTTLNWCQ